MRRPQADRKRVFGRRSLADLPVNLDPLTWHYLSPFCSSLALCTRPAIFDSDPRVGLETGAKSTRESALEESEQRGRGGIYFDASRSP